MKMLITNKPKRLFTFGCSFTDYIWGTWANILGYEFRKADFYNFGKAGAGNQYIFNVLMQADAAYNFTHEDLIVVQWTNVSREDRYFHAGHHGVLHDSETKHGAWSTPGNIYSQDIYDEEWVKKYFSEYGALVRDLAFIKAAHGMLKHKTQWHFIQMNNLVHYVDQWDSKITLDQPKIFGNKERIRQLRELYAETISILQPSFYDVLYNNNWTQKFKADKKLVNKFFQDGHPHPLEHYDFLKRTFKHEWRPSTNEKVGEIQKKWVKLMNDVSATIPKFSIYNETKRWHDMAKFELCIRQSNNIDFRTHR